MCICWCVVEINYKMHGAKIKISKCNLAFLYGFVTWSQGKTTVYCCTRVRCWEECLGPRVRKYQEDRKRCVVRGLKV